jgi:hypothetical protein
MNAKKKPESDCGVCKDTVRTKPDLKLIKGGLESLREQLQKRIIDNPATARKAAVVIQTWLDKPAKKSAKK